MFVLVRVSSVRSPVFVCWYVSVCVCILRVATVSPFMCVVCLFAAHTNTDDRVRTHTHEHKRTCDRVCHDRRTCVPVCSSRVCVCAFRVSFYVFVQSVCVCVCSRAKPFEKKMLVCGGDGGEGFLVYK
jgi:hypothetical protein